MIRIDWKGLGIGGGAWFAVALGFTACSGASEDPPAGSPESTASSEAPPSASAASDEEGAPPPTLGAASATPIACATTADCYTECKNSVSNFGYECVSASVYGYGFKNRCAWLTVSSKLTPPGANGATTLYNDTTRKGVAYQACVN